ncbi:unnamed protein product, partial [Allacma fusca]
KSHITYLQNFEILLHWFFRIDQSLAIVDTKCSSRTVVDWWTFAREVCHVALKNQRQSKIGCPGYFVEVDETHLFRRKYNRGHRIKESQTEKRERCGQSLKETFVLVASY